MFRLILGAVGTVLSIYDLLVLVYVILMFIKPAANQWTELLNRLVEPVLAPVRGFLNAKLPDKVKIIDWSPVAVWIVIGLVQRLISILRG